MTSEKMPEAYKELIALGKEDVPKHVKATLEIDSKEARQIVEYLARRDEMIRADERSKMYDKLSESLVRDMRAARQLKQKGG